MPGPHKCSVPHFLPLAGNIRFLALAEHRPLHLASVGRNGAPGLTVLLAPFSESLIYASQSLFIHHTKSRILLWCDLIQQLAQRKSFRKRNGTKPFGKVGTVRIFGFLDLKPKENMQIKHFGLDQNELKASFLSPNKAKTRRWMEHLKVFHAI